MSISSVLYYLILFVIFPLWIAAVAVWQIRYGDEGAARAATAHIRGLRWIGNQFSRFVSRKLRTLRMHWRRIRRSRPRLRQFVDRWFAA